VAIGDGERRQHTAGNVAVKAIIIEEPALTEPHERLVAKPMARFCGWRSTDAIVSSVAPVAECQGATRGYADLISVRWSSGSAGALSSSAAILARTCASR
jgi:hypothetical protein